MTVLAVDEPAAVVPGRAWPWIRRTAFRFTSAYWMVFMALYTGIYLSEVPGLRTVVTGWKSVVDTSVVWVGRRVFGLSIALAPSGSGDKTVDWVQAFCMAVLAVGIGLVWWSVDRRRREYDRGAAWLRVAMRYALALPMITYGMGKVIKLQFPEATIERLLEPYGQSSPMGLLWTFMGYSSGYNLFTGLVEAIGGVLLLRQRTTPLGALLVVIGMSNVVILNFTYDVPVKLYSANLLLMGIALLLPDAKRLLSVLVFNRPADAAALRQPSSVPWRRRAELALKATAAAGVVYLASAVSITYWLSRQGNLAPLPPLYGLYDVRTHTRDGVEVPALFTDRTRWRRVVFGRNDSMSIYFGDDSRQQFRIIDDVGHRSIELVFGIRTNQKQVFHYERSADGIVTLSGTFYGSPMEVRLRPVPLDSFLLVNRGFNWVQESPFNR